MENQQTLTLPSNVDSDILALNNTSAKILGSISEGWKYLVTSLTEANKKITELETKIKESEKAKSELKEGK